MNKIKNIDSLKIANTVPTKDDKINMIAKLVCETADLQRKNENLTNILTELEEWLKEQGNNGIDEWGNHYTICLFKLNKLKEKYK